MVAPFKPLVFACKTDLTDAKYNEELLKEAIRSNGKNTDERIASALESIANSLWQLSIHS